MMDCMANLFVDVHLFKAKLTLFLDHNCVLIASTLSEFSLRQMLLSVLANRSTNFLRHALYRRRSSRFDLVFHGMWAETHPNIR